MGREVGSRAGAGRGGAGRDSPPPPHGGVLRRRGEEAFPPQPGFSEIGRAGQELREGESVRLLQDQGQGLSLLGLQKAFSRDSQAPGYTHQPTLTCS